MDKFEKVIATLMLVILGTMILAGHRDITEQLKRNRERNNSYAMSRIIECEHQISLLRERIERLEESK